MLVFRSPLTHLQRWAISSQQHARRNAMVQLNAFSAVRAQREEVRDFLESARAPAPEVGVARRG